MKISDMDFISCVISLQHLIMKESKNMPTFTSPNSLNSVSVPTLRWETVLYLDLGSLWKWFQLKRLIKISFINGWICYGTLCNCQVKNILTKRNFTLPGIISFQLWANLFSQKDQPIQMLWINKYTKNGLRIFH